MKKKILLSLAIFLIITGVVIQASGRLGKKNGVTNFNDIKILDIDPLEQSAGTTGASLRVLSANLIAEFEQSASPTVETLHATSLPEENGDATESAETTPSANPSSPSVETLHATSLPTQTPIPLSKIKTLRILGEIQNTGTKTVENAVPIIIFYDSSNKKISSKIAAWSDNYDFPALKRKEKFLYDIILTSLPEGFANLAINFKPTGLDSGSAAGMTGAGGISKTLKIKNRDIEEKVATASGGQTVVYYTLRGQMVNTGKKSAKNCTVVAYGKDRDSRIFTWNRQDFPSDLFSAGQKQDISISLFPFKDAKLENVEVYLFGEEL